jgi:hypothetical protein
VEAEDQAGNVSYDDNAGVCYTFTTPEIPDFFTEQDPGDLDGLRLLFVPNGSFDYYAGCTESIYALPVDPAGGTALSGFSPSNDDGYLAVTPSQPVSLYGVSYNEFYVGTNGYITFGAGDNDYSESLAEHFEMPRVAALYDDLDPGQGGTVSWKELPNCVVVTFENVPEHNNGNSNTFQIELFYDGSIAMSYLGLASADHIAGLSAGAGLSPDYYPSDLSHMISCGPQPPRASNTNTQVNVNGSLLIDLIAYDDGLPDPPAALTYIVTALPTHGILEDGGTPITAVPYTIAGGGNQVTYVPNAWYGGVDSLQFMVNDGGTAPTGGDSNVATVSIMVGGPRVLVGFYMDTDPGWKTEGQWAFGQPTGGGSHNYDPTGGYTDTNVYGYNLNGDYTDEMAKLSLTTTPIDCTEASQVTLKFWRWLGVESSEYDEAGIEVSTDMSTWTPVWTHSGVAISDDAWAQFEYDLSAVADGQSTVYVRWWIGPTDDSVTYPGWNIDDVEIWAVLPVVPPTCPGDANCDDVINWRDIDYFVAAQNDNVAGWEAMFAAAPTCLFENNDVNNDGSVNWRDIDPFVALMNTTCP